MRAILIALSLCLVLSPAFAGHGNKGKNKSESGFESNAALSVDIGVVFSAGEARIMRDYFHTNPFPAKSLPPGIAKNLARGKPLPPGIAKKFLPADLTHRLPRHDGYETVIVGSDIVRIAVATGVIIDILKDVF